MHVRCRFTGEAPNFLTLLDDVPSGLTRYLIGHLATFESPSARQQPDVLFFTRISMILAVARVVELAVYLRGASQSRINANL